MCVPDKSDSKLKRIIAKKQFANLDSLENCYNEKFVDILSSSTQCTKNALQYLENIFVKIQKSKTYTILLGTTQPAHLITILAVAYLACVFYSDNPHPQQLSPLSNFLYLAAFSTYVGTQIWMTFVSGLTLYFTLPRHNFGDVQRALFPKYFAFNSALTLCTLTIYVRRHQEELFQPEIALQATIHTISFLINLMVRLYFAPPLLKLMTIKTRIEKAAQIGMEVGSQDVGPLKNCPHYIMIHKSFRKVHMSIAVGNILAMACTVFHLYHLSTKLCFITP